MTYSRITTALTMLVLTLATTGWSVAPHPDVAAKWKADGVYEEKTATWRAFRAAGGGSPVEHTPLDETRRAQRLSLSYDAVDTAHVIVILVDFDDNPSSAGSVDAQPYQFDSVLFSHPETHSPDMLNPTGSMTEFYMENSYGTFFIKGDIYGWYRMPETYDYYRYLGDDDGTGMGEGRRELVYEAAMAAEADGADFSRYDSDGDGWCDGLIVVHAGAGAETGADGIWSHKGSISTLILDGVKIEDYTMNPEEYADDGIHPIGVFCHEYGHFLGLPDYYDVDYEPASSDGLGRWSLMATGNYNGDSRKPAHMDAWCKLSVAGVGFVQPTVVHSNLHQAEIPCSEHSPVVFRLENPAVAPGEYWLVENRQKVGFDAGIPGDGLLIYHFDADAPSNNSNYLRYRLALEQADGNNDLALTENNRGDVGDPFPGYTDAREWHKYTVPDSRANELGPNSGAITQVGVWNISDSDSIMYADLDVSYSRPWIELYGPTPIVVDESEGGDGDGHLEVGETVQISMDVINQMRPVFNARVYASSNNPDVVLMNDDASIGYLGSAGTSTNEPIEFTIRNDATPIIDTIWLEIVGDSLMSVQGTEEFSALFAVEVSLGGPQVLLIDDDGGDDYDETMAGWLYELRMPYEVWHTDIQGSPSEADLTPYSMVFWHTGKAGSGVINTSDMTAMRGYLDGGGNLFLGSADAVADLDALDPAFLPEYFGADPDGTTFYPIFNAADQTPFEDTVGYYWQSGAPNTPQPILVPVGSGEEVILTAHPATPSVVGVANRDTLSHRTVLLSFAPEWIGEKTTPQAYYGSGARLLGLVMQFFGATSQVPTDVDDQPMASLPSSFELAQNYPNPFNPTTTISYTLRPTSGHPPVTSLSIYNALGQRVTTLVDESQLPGTYTVQWNGTTDAGKAVSTGVYFYRLKRGSDAETRKMVLMK